MRNIRQKERVKRVDFLSGKVRATTGKRMTVPGLDANANDGALVGEPATPGEFILYGPDGVSIVSTGTMYQDTGDGSSVLANDGTYSADYAHRLGVPFAVPVDWRDIWASGTYNVGDMVIDGGYTMVANKTTTDKPAPVADGAPGWTLPDVPLWITPNQAGAVYSGHEYTITGLIFIDGVRCWRPETTDIAYVLAAQDITDPAFPILLGSAEVPVGTVGWFGINLPPALYAVGAKLRITLIAEKTVGETSFTRPWAFQGIGIDVDPGSGNYERDAAQLNLYISKTDSNVADASADLATLADGDRLDLVETATPARFENYRIAGTPVDNGTYYTFPVTVTSQGSAIRSGTGVTISGFAAGGADTIYNNIANHWIGAVTPDVDVKGFVTDNLATIPLDDDAYGVDLRGNGFTVSPDWDLLASSAGGGGNTGAGVEFNGAYAINAADTHTVAAPNVWEEYVPGVAVTTQLSGTSYAAGRLTLDTPGSVLQNALVINASIRIPAKSQDVSVGFGLNGVEGTSIELIKAVSGSSANPTADLVQNLVVTIPKATSLVPGDQISVFIKSTIANVIDVIAMSLFVAGEAT